MLQRNVVYGFQQYLIFWLRAFQDRRLEDHSGPRGLDPAWFVGGSPPHYLLGEGPEATLRRGHALAALPGPTALAAAHKLAPWYTVQNRMAVARYFSQRQSQFAQRQKTATKLPVLSHPKGHPQYEYPLVKHDRTRNCCYCHPFARNSSTGHMPHTKSSRSAGGFERGLPDKILSQTL